MTKTIKKIIHKTFEIGVVVKSLFGFVEILAGIFVAVAGEKLIDNFLINLAMDEIYREPNDFFARHFIIWSTDLYLGSKVFAVLYLLFHGIANLLLVVALLKEKAWGYHWAMVGFTLFVIYQVYEYCHTFSVSLLWLTIFDILFIIIILLEYRKLRKKK